MKKIIYITLALALLLTGCGGKKQSNESESTVLNVGVIAADDRYSAFVNGEISGIEPELARDSAALLERELNIRVVSNETELYTGLEDGSFDVIFGRISDTSPALKPYMVSSYYGRSGIYFVTKKYDYMDSLSIRGGGSVGVMTSVSPLSDQIPGIDSFATTAYTDLQEMARDVSAGLIVAGVCNEREALSLASDAVQVQEVAAGPSEYYVAAIKDNAKIKSAVDQTVSAYYDALAAGTDDSIQDAVVPQMPVALPAAEGN